ncbi:hypothetical protein VCUG_01629 [Vavraia culicis subsp. floridensis]|uniref:Uncharacterized protein n=1 Tax=Vavraia culicis (isolate floridensis) TaxID=948595 RepID=L2GUS4_VAVCU|nr:uncharacterized protein VCUG_01629 [Vavraia culicis subsp. floridensis]ELA46855.1 hypothetical protein VCUG_01629 [Vavraia culicis subsp. floridensis]
MRILHLTAFTFLIFRQTHVDMDSSSAQTPISDEGFVDELLSHLQQLHGDLDLTDFQEFDAYVEGVDDEYLSASDMNYVTTHEWPACTVAEIRRKIHTNLKASVMTMCDKFGSLLIEYETDSSAEMEILITRYLLDFFLAINEKLGNDRFKNTHNWFVKCFCDFLLLFKRDIEPLLSKYGILHPVEQEDQFDKDWMLLIQMCEIALDLVRENYDHFQQSQLNLRILVRIVNYFEEICMYITTKYLWIDEITECLCIDQMMHELTAKLLFFTNAMVLIMDTNFKAVPMEKICKCGFYHREGAVFKRKDQETTCCTMCLVLSITESYSLDR